MATKTTKRMVADLRDKIVDLEDKLGVSCAKSSHDPAHLQISFLILEILESLTKPDRK